MKSFCSRSAATLIALSFMLGTLLPELCAQTWSLLPGLGKDIGVGAGGSVWLIGTNRVGVAADFGVLKWNGTDWDGVDGGGVRIAVGPDGQPWMVNSVGQIFHRQGNSWGSPLPGLGKDIGVGADGSVWLIGTNRVGVAADFGVLKWNGTDWDGVDGGGVRIAVGPDGQPWMVNSVGQIFHRQGNSWGSPLPGLGKDIGVGADGSVWLIGTNRVGVAADFGVLKWNGTDWEGVDGGGVRIAVGPDGQPWLVNSVGQIYHQTVVVRRSDIYVEIDKSVSGVLPAKPFYTEPPRIKPDGSAEKIGVNRQPLASVPDRMWNPDQTLNVRMTGGSAMVRSKVRQYAVEWSQYANIKFAFVDERQPAEIKIDFDQDRSNWSLIGRDALLIPFNFSTMHFGELNDNTPDTRIKRVVLHEFGHALGLIHEHQSPASGIQWDKEKTYKYYRETQGWDKGMVDSNVLDKYSVNSTNYSQFDPTSIMMYEIPAGLTLDGHGTPYNTTLSAIDKEYIRRWYPHPGDATGQLRTGDDCDLIEFSVEYGVVAADLVTFRLNPGSNVTWWKSIEVPIGGSGYIELQIHDQVSSVRDISRSDIDNSRPIRFNKAKFLGIHTPLQYRWDVLSALPGGTRVTLNWVKDHCP